MKKLTTIVLALAPVAAFAQANPVSQLITNIGGWIDSLLPILVTLAIVVFFWGLVKYIWSADSEEAKDGGKRLMIWGMIALFVMVALWAIIGFFQTALGVSGAITTGTAPTGKIVPSLTK